MISVPIKKRFRNFCRVYEERFVAPKNLIAVLRENPLYRKTFLDSTDVGLKTVRPVSLCLSDLEVNWTSSSLVQSDKLVTVLHLLFAPVRTVVKPAHGLRPIPEAASRRFPLSHRLML